MRFWEGMRKKLREHYRKNEFISACRNEVQEDFCAEVTGAFKDRMRTYDGVMDTSHCDLAKFSRHEKRLNTMVETYFYLFNKERNF